MQEQCANVSFGRADAETLGLPEQQLRCRPLRAGLDVPARSGSGRPRDASGTASRRPHHPGGLGTAIPCGWAELFPIVDAEVASDVCPLFFRLGQGESLAGICLNAGFDVTAHSRISETLIYPTMIKPATRRSSGDPWRSRGRASAKPLVSVCASDISIRSLPGAAGTARTGSRASLSLWPRPHPAKKGTPQSPMPFGRRQADASAVPSRWSHVAQFRRPPG